MRVVVFALVACVVALAVVAGRCVLVLAEVPRTVEALVVARGVVAFVVAWIVVACVVVAWVVVTWVVVAGTVRAWMTE